MEIVALVVGALALVVAWLSWRTSARANRISGESNQIARRALHLTEAEHSQRQRDREARARLTVSIEPGANHDLDQTGAIWTSAGTIITSLVVSLINSGERAAGRTNVEVWVPRVPHGEPYWAEGPGGHQLQDAPGATHDPGVRLNAGGGAQLYDSMRLSRAIERVAVGVPETLYIRAPLNVEGPHAEYPVDVVVRAEGADGDARARTVVRINRRQ